jgi:D-tyrosyl-tRNA(Tyr) deacylase
VAEAHGEALVVSQFTLMGDVRRGNRPSWAAAARPEDASPVVEAVARALEAEGVPVATGRFGAMMDVELVNDGPVTLVLDSDDLAAARR